MPRCKRIDFLAETLAPLLDGKTMLRCYQAIRDASETSGPLGHDFDRLWPNAGFSVRSVDPQVNLDDFNIRARFLPPTEEERASLETIENLQ